MCCVLEGVIRCITVLVVLSFYISAALVVFSLDSVLNSEW